MGIKAKKKSDKNDFKHKDIIQIIFDALPKQYKKGKPVHMKKETLETYSKISAVIFQEVIDYIIRERDTMMIRNHVILEKATYEKLRSNAIVEGSRIGAETTLKRFKEKSLGKRLRCAFSGHIN